jgi:DNA-binding CsgD family transcriptional regulator
MGEPERAVEHLAEVEPVDRTVGNPAVLACVGDVVEARLRAGEVAAAERALSDFERRIALAPSAWAGASLARCQALLAADEEADERFAAALAACDRRVSPLERARTQLCYGERLRRGGRRVLARAQLRAALETFEALGAECWRRRAEQELAASGQHLRRGRVAPTEQLTPQELQVGLMASSGTTTREIAAALFLSPRTVELHLTRIYGKLGLRSRAELGRHFAVEAAPH